MSVGQSAAPGSLEVAVGGVAVSEQRELPTGPSAGPSEGAAVENVKR